MGEASYHLGNRRRSARVESRHPVSSGNGRPLHRIEPADIADEAAGDRIRRGKTVSDGERWNEVETESGVAFDARLDLDRNKVQLFNVRVEVAPPDGSPRWKLR